MEDIPICVLQVCVLIFLPHNYLPSEVKLIAVSKEAMTNYFTENGEWTYQFSRVELQGHIISLSIGFRRESSFIIVNVLLPILLMATMNILVFIIPPDAGERISYSVTVLLALAVYLTIVGENLPKTSRPMPIFCYYLTAVVILSVSMCFVTIINLRIYHKDETTAPPACIQGFVNVLKCHFYRNSHRLSSVKTNERAYIVGENSMTKGPGISVLVQRTGSLSWKELSQVLDVLGFLCFVIAALVINVYYILKLQGYKFVEQDWTPKS